MSLARQLEVRGSRFEIRELLTRRAGQRQLRGRDVGGVTDVWQRVGAIRPHSEGRTGANRSVCVYWTLLGVLIAVLCSVLRERASRRV